MKTQQFNLDKENIKIKWKNRCRKVYVRSFKIRLSNFSIKQSLAEMLRTEQKIKIKNNRVKNLKIQCGKK
jgi:hypothetical protein